MAGINDGLIAYWNFDDCDTVDPVVTDATGNANHGTVLGNDPNSECVDSAVRGKAYRLVGTTEWSNPSGGNILIPMFPFASWPGFSVCLWVNEEDMLHPHGNAYISWGRSSWSQWVAIGHFADAGTSWPDTLHYVGGTAYPPLIIEFDTLSDRNRYVHHCVVHDNGTGTTRGYKDSVFVGEISQPVVNVYGSLGYIARHYWTAGDVTRFTGIVDEVRVYDRALTDSEIAEVYAHGTYTCEGFDPPVHAFAVKVKKNRAIPFKGLLRDGDGNVVFNLDPAPAIQVIYTPNGGGGATDVTDQALPAGMGTDGNQFEPTAEEKWQYNLLTKNYSAPGTYEVSMVSSDQHIISPCTASFVIE
jgi:hypothetical protein